MQTGKRGAFLWMPLILMLALAADTRRLSGQNVGETTAVVDTSWPGVNLNVVVLNRDGLPQRIDVPDLQLFENGAERRVQFLGSPGSPVSLALMIDSSGSIFKRKDAILAAVKSIVKGMPEGSEAMAVSFNGNAFLEFDFTDISRVDFAFIDRLQANGPTALYDAVWATEDHLVARAKYMRRALVILSDGEDNASHIPRQRAFRKMQQNGAPAVYACVLSKANVLRRNLMVAHVNMSFLAKRGGGTECNLDTDPAASQIVDAIRNQYAIQFTAGDATRDGKARKLHVRLSAKEMQVHSLPEYFAPLK